MSPGREDSREGPAPWPGGRSRDLGDRVSRLEVQFENIDREIRDIAESLKSLAVERREAGKELSKELKGLSDRIVIFEQERRHWLRVFKLAITVSGIVAAGWKFFGDTILSILRAMRLLP